MQKNMWYFGSIFVRVMLKFSTSFDCWSYLRRGRNKCNEYFILKIPEFILTEGLRKWNAEYFIEIFKFLILLKMLKLRLVSGFEKQCCLLSNSINWCYWRYDVIDLVICLPRHKKDRFRQSIKKCSKKLNLNNFAFFTIRQPSRHFYVSVTYCH